jgi:tetratricopeptide (TPR) repeat protein
MSMTPQDKQPKPQSHSAEGELEVPVSRSDQSRSKSRISLRVMGPVLLVGVCCVVFVHWWFSWGLFHSDPRPPLVWTPASETDEQALIEEVRYAGDRLTEIFPTQPDAWHSKALIQRRFGTREAAIACWQRCLKLDSEYALAYYSLGLEALEEGEYEKSVGLLESAIQFDEQMDTAYLSLAQALIKLGRAEEAIEPLKAFSRLVPASPAGHFRLGQIFLDLGQNEQAVDQYLQGLEIRSEYAPAYEGLAEASARLGQRDKQEQYRKKLQELTNDTSTIDPAPSSTEQESPTSAEFAAAHTHVAKVYLVYGDSQDAERHWLRAAELCPSDIACRQMLIDVFIGQGRTREALGIARQLADIDPQNASHFSNVGALSFQSRQYDMAEQAYRQVIELAPESYRGYAALAEVLLKAERNIGEAKQFAEEAVQRAPIADNHYLLGVALARNGDRQKAVEALTRATELDAVNPDYRDALEQLKAEDEFREDD